MMDTITEQITLTIITCYKCGIAFGMPEHYVRKRREDHVSWFCPNGHEQGSYGKSKAEKAQVELVR